MLIRNKPRSRPITALIIQGMVMTFIKANDIFERGRKSTYKFINILLIEKLEITKNILLNKNIQVLGFINQMIDKFYTKNDVNSYQLFYKLAMDSRYP